MTPFKLPPAAGQWSRQEGGQSLLRGRGSVSPAKPTNVYGEASVPVAAMCKIGVRAIGEEQVWKAGHGDPEIGPGVMVAPDDAEGKSQLKSEGTREALDMPIGW